MKYYFINKQALIVASLLLIFSSITSCRKEDDSESIDLSQREKLIGDWLLTGLLADPPLQVLNTPVTNYFNTLDSCYRDDYYSFESNNQYTFHLNDTKCYPQQDEITGTWTFNSDKTRLILTDNNNSSQSENLTEYYIKQLTSRRLELLYTFANSNNQQFTYIYTKK